MLAQADVVVSYFVIAHRSKRDAHNLLYRLFTEHASDFDLLVKLDGDMVLGDQYTFRRALDFLEQRPEIELVLLPVRDSLTGRELVGMHLYRPTVRWIERPDNLFTDSNSLGPEQQAVSALALQSPVLHCPDPGDFQSFHFGVHRGAKLVAALEDSRHRYVRSHLRDVVGVWRMARRDQGRAHSLALRGLALGLSGQINEDELSYTHPRLHDHYRAEVLPLHSRRLLRESQRSVVRAVARRPRLLGLLVAVAARDATRGPHGDNRT
jgi:hypothetical protein